MAFFALLLVSSFYALIRGGRPEKIGAVTLLGGACLSALFIRPHGPRFHNVESGVLVIDALIFGIFLWLAVRSTRFWPMWIAAMLGAEVLVHVMLMTVPDVVPEAYMDAIALWSWLAQVLLIVATRRHRNRLRHWGVDVPWKT
jgi:hypothetical protein